MLEHIWPSLGLAAPLLAVYAVILAVMLGLMRTQEASLREASKRASSGRAEEEWPSEDWRDLEERLQTEGPSPEEARESEEGRLPKKEPDRSEGNIRP